MVKTTLDVIKFLPFDENLKKDLIESYEGLDPEKKYNIGMMMWAAYNALFELKLERNLEIAFEEAMNNQEKLNAEFYDRVRDLTQNEMDQVTTEEIQALDLDITRQKLAEMIKTD